MRGNTITPIAFLKLGGLLKIKPNLAKLDDGFDESPTVMVGETKQNWVKIGAY